MALYYYELKLKYVTLVVTNFNFVYFNLLPFNFLLDLLTYQPIKKMIHEILMVLSGLKSSVIDIRNLEAYNDTTIFHPSEVDLLSRVAQFGSLHRKILKAVEGYNRIQTDSQPLLVSLPLSFLIAKPLIISVINQHVLEKLSLELLKIEQEILTKTKYVGSQNTISTSKLIHSILIKWEKVLNYAEQLLKSFQIIPTESKSNHIDYQNVFALFYTPIGYQYVDEIRTYCLLSIHKAWVKIITSWLLYGYVAIDPSIDNSDNEQIVKRLLLPSKQLYDQYFDQRLEYSGNTELLCESAFLPPGISLDVGNMIFATGNMVRMFLGVSSAYRLDESKIGSTLELDKSFKGHNLKSITTAYISTFSRLRIPVLYSQVIQAVKMLRSDILKSIGSHEFRKSRIIEFFFLLRQVVLCGDDDYNMQFLDQISIFEAEIRKRVPLELQTIGKSINSQKDFDQFAKLIPEDYLHQRAPEILRRALLNIAEKLPDKCFDESNLAPQRYKEMYIDASNYLTLISDPNFIQKDEDLFATTLLDIPLNISLKFNWFQSAISRNPQLLSIKYSRMYSYLISLYTIRYVLIDDWSKSRTKLKSLNHNNVQFKNLNANTEYYPKYFITCYNKLSFSLHLLMLALNIFWEYYQVTIIDSSFDDFIKNCGLVLDVDSVEPDSIANYHQQYVTKVYESLFFNDKEFPHLMQKLFSLIKSISKWKAVNEGSFSDYNKALNKTEYRHFINDMETFSITIYSSLQQIYKKIETIQQSEENSTSKYSLHQLLLRLEFINDIKDQLESSSKNMHTDDIKDNVIIKNIVQIQKGVEDDEVQISTDPEEY